MSSAKIIENPEVPGLECFLPPPPPPPPPIAPSTERDNGTTSGGPTCGATSETTGTKDSVADANAAAAAAAAAVAQMVAAGSDVGSKVLATVTTVTTVTVPNPPTTAPAVETSAPTYPSMPVATAYMLHPAGQPVGQPVGQPAATPWWVPTEADTTELYAQWYDTTYKAAAATVSSPTVQGSGKAKNKYYKRKNEVIDPALDAEKVASAQRELSALMKPLKCDLCNAVMNSTLQAKLHYDGKPHQKKVSMFLNQSVKKQKTDDGQLSNSNSNDWQNYCDICKTWFTSQTDATQHYSGKKHIRAANGGPRARPSKKTPSPYNQVDPSGRYGIGLAFHQDGQPLPSGPVAATAGVDGAPSVVPPGGLYTPPPYPTPLRCDLCGVSANRQDQLETHKRGARHLRMLRLNGLPVPEPVSENETTPAVPGPIDYSIYRTPSGQYYCAPCNLSLNSESTFAQHVESKKHKNQSNPKSPSNAVVVAKKARFKKK